MNLNKHCERVMTVGQMAVRDDWLAMRRSGIGGSDAAALIGLSPWKSAYQLWLEKTGQVEEEDISDKEAVELGNLLEPAVADFFQKREGKKVKRYGMVRSLKYPFMLADFDRLLVGEDAGLEIKTTNAFARKAWDEGEIPPQYYVQCQHYMMVSGLPRWYIAALIGGQHYDCKIIERNEGDIAELEKAEVAFWDKVMSRQPPEVDGSDSCTEALRERFQGGRMEAVPLPAEAGELIETIDRLKESEKELKTKKQKAQNKLCAMLGDHELGMVGEGDDARIVRWKIVAGRTTLDSKRLKKDHPDIYEAYSKTGEPTRQFSVA